MAALKTTTFRSLYKHFVSQTSKARPAVCERQLEEILTSPTTEEYQKMQEEIYNKTVSDKEETNPVFHQYCHEVETHYHQTSCEN